MAQTTVKRKRKHSEIIEDEFYARAEAAPATPWFARLFRLLVIAPVAWTWRLCIRLISGVWNATKTATWWTLRSSWRIVTWSARTAWDATVWTVKLPFRGLAWMWQAVFGPPVRYSNPRYAEIHALIARRYRRRSRFITHLFAFIFFNLAIWIDYFYTDYTYYFDPRALTSTPLLFTIMWGVVLLFHFIRTKHGVEEDHTIERAIEREREWEARQPQDTFIHERYARLVDNGDAVELRQFMDEAAWEKRKNRD
jgi:hypothetical protein